MNYIRTETGLCVGNCWVQHSARYYHSPPYKHLLMLLRRLPHYQATPLPGKLPPRGAAQLLVDDRVKALERPVITAADGRQQPRNFVFGLGRHGYV